MNNKPNSERDRWRAWWEKCYEQIPNAKEARELMFSYLVFLSTGIDPHDTFDYMLSLKKKYGCKSTFFIMAGGNNKHFDYNDY